VAYTGFSNLDLLKMGVIEEVEHSDVQYLSPIFTVPKKDGEYRMILNLKDLNLNIDYYHFKWKLLKRP
jgi:hypothetical protein